MLKIATVLCVVLFAGLFAAAQANETPWAAYDPNTGGAVGLTPSDPRIGQINPQTQIQVQPGGRSIQELIEQFIADMVARGFIHVSAAQRAAGALEVAAGQVGVGASLGLGVFDGSREPER